MNVKKNLGMMAALVGVAVLILKLKREVNVTNIDLPETPGVNLPNHVTSDPFLLPYLQTNPGIWDGSFSSDPFDKVFNVSLDDRGSSERYIPIFGFAGNGTPAQSAPASPYPHGVFPRDFYLGQGAG